MSQQSKFASFPRLDPVREADTVKGKEIEGATPHFPREHLLPLSRKLLIIPFNPRTPRCGENSHRPSRISNEEGCKPDETRSRQLLW